MRAMIRRALSAGPFLSLFLASSSVSAAEPILSFPPAALEIQRRFESVFLSTPSPDSASRHLRILTEGLAIGARHITVSTVGILPAMRQLAARPEQFRLAISLHAPSRERRRRLMPIEQKYDLDAVLRAAKAFARRVTLEYVLIAGANDTIEDADQLARHAGRLGALVNLLPLHPGGDPDLSPASPRRIKAFADRLRNQGVEAVVRRSRGLDIDAACGQLRARADQPAALPPDR